jgi:N utilization substance protein A
MSTGRRCPNASLPGSRYCGLDSHQALRRFETDKVAVLSGLDEADIAALADAERSDEDVAEIVARAAAAAPDAAEAPPDEGLAEDAAPDPEPQPAEEMPPEEALAEEAAPEPDGLPAAGEPTAGPAGEGAA